MSESKYTANEALGPFFEIIMRGLSGVVDGDHYFDTIAEDATFEFLYEFPGWPRTIRGRAELMTAYSGYGNSVRLRSADKLVVYHAENGKVVIIEYEVHVISPMNDLSISDGNDRDEPIVIGSSRSQDLAVGLSGRVERPEPGVFLMSLI